MEIVLGASNKLSKCMLASPLERSNHVQLTHDDDSVDGTPNKDVNIAETRR